MSGARAHLTLTLTLATAVACEQATDHPEVGSSSSSVVTYEEFPPQDAVRWGFDSVPVVSIGVARGEPEYEFSRIRGVAPFGEGYLIADRASNEIRHFDRAGRHVQTVGGAGEGPGEFTVLAWMGVLHGDTVLAWELRNRRLSVFDRELRLVETRSLVPNDIYVVEGAFGDGDLLLWPFAGSPVRQVTAPQVLEGTSYFALVRAAQPAVMDTILRLPARPSYITPDGPLLRIPLTTEPSVALGQSEVWAGNGTTGSLSRYDKGGDKILELVMPGGGAIEGRDVDAYVAQDLEGSTGAERAGRARLFPEMPMPDEFPSFDRLLVDGDGNVWVRAYLRLGAETQEWAIFGEGGEPRGAIELPGQFEVRVVVDDRMLGVWRDEFGVESVRVYRLLRR